MKIPNTIYKGSYLSFSNPPLDAHGRCAYATSSDLSYFDFRFPGISACNESCGVIYDEIKDTGQYFTYSPVSKVKTKTFTFRYFFHCSFPPNGIDRLQPRPPPAPQYSIRLQASRAQRPLAALRAVPLAYGVQRTRQSSRRGRRGGLLPIGLRGGAIASDRMPQERDPHSQMGRYGLDGGKTVPARWEDGPSLRTAKAVWLRLRRGVSLEAVQIHNLGHSSRVP